MFQRKSPESAGPSQCIRNSSGRRPEEPCVLPAATVSCATILRGLPSHQITSCSGLRCCGSADGLPQTASSVITASQCPDSRRKIGLFASCCHASIGRRLCAQRGVVAGLHFSGFFGFPSGARRSITNPQALIKIRAGLRQLTPRTRAGIMARGTAGMLSHFRNALCTVMMPLPGRILVIHLITYCGSAFPLRG